MQLACLQVAAGRETCSPMGVMETRRGGSSAAPKTMGGCQQDVTVMTTDTRRSRADRACLRFTPFSAGKLESGAEVDASGGAEAGGAEASPGGAEGSA